MIESTYTFGILSAKCFFATRMEEHENSNTHAKESRYINQAFRISRPALKAN